nr:immunoglobulin light chain junction region [Mus musculus]NSL99786.1 immunoglobulin light chain junction region [Mus musculus]NSM00893.1 immunoglobulin light chain junction region [Mus musculus]
CFQGSHLPWTF